MNKRIKNASMAFRSGTVFNGAIDKVRIHESGNILWHQHGNLIACLNRASRRLTLSDCGWQTVSTKARLNATLRTFGLGSISQVKGVWIFRNANGSRNWAGTETFTF